MNFIDGKLYRKMQQANIPDDLVLKMDQILRNNPDCELLIIKQFVDHMVRLEKIASHLADNDIRRIHMKQSNYYQTCFTQLIDYCNFKRGDLIKAILKAKERQTI